MQNPGEDLETIDNARSWPGEIGAGINDVDLFVTGSRQRFEMRKTAEQFVIARGALDIVTAKREHDDFRLRIEHLLPFDLC